MLSNAPHFSIIGATINRQAEGNLACVMPSLLLFLAPSAARATSRVCCPNSSSRALPSA